MVNRGKRKGYRKIEYRQLEIGEQIAGGGFAVVYKGRWKHRDVALKTLFDPDFSSVKKEYMDELLVMSNLKHKNIVELLGACIEPPKLFFVMELCGMSLFHLLHLTNQELSTTRRVEFMIDIASALEYLHGSSPQIVHRDVKSLNCLLSNEGVLKICDFGLVSTRKRESGTPAYMAPELLRDVSTFSFAVDVFSFAVLLWETLCRKIPWEGMDVSSIKRNVLKDARLDIPVLDFPEDCAILVKKCWQRRPGLRPRMSAVREALVKCKESVRTDACLLTLRREGDGDALDELFRSRK